MRRERDRTVDTKYPRANCPPKGDRKRTPRTVLSGFEPAAFRPFVKEVTARSLPPKMFPGENRRSSPGALPARRFRVEPALVYCSQRLQARRGDRFGAKYLRHHCPENWSARRDSHPHGRGPRVSETRVYAISPLAENLVEEAGFAPAKVGDRRVYSALPLAAWLLLGETGADGGICTHSGLAPTGISGRRVCWFRHIRGKSGQVVRSRTGVLAVTTRCSACLSYAPGKGATARRETLDTVSAFASSVATDGGKWSDGARSAEIAQPRTKGGVSDAGARTAGSVASNGEVRTHVVSVPSRVPETARLRSENWVRVSGSHRPRLGL